MSRSGRNAKAEDYFRRAPNYSAEAIPALRERASIQREPRLSAMLGEIADAIEASHKFVLPNGGYLFEETTEPMLAELRTPFPKTVFEFAGAFDISPDEGNGVFAKFIDKMIVCCFPNSGGETIITTVTHVTKSANPAALGWRASLLAARLSAAGIEVFPLGEAAEQFPLFSKDRREILLRTCAREIGVVAQACAALACTNVTTEIVRPNREARAARPASTLFDYHVLMIQPDAERHPSEDRGGTHASPRTHIRRGHIRRLAWGPRIWVNSSVVNPGAIGTVNKDYAVSRS